MQIERQDMETVLAALNTARYKSVSEDMVESYRQMDVRGKASPFTKQLERAVEVLENYLALEEEEEDVVSE